MAHPAIVDILALFIPVCLSVCILCLVRLIWILPGFRTQVQQPRKSSVRIVVVLGSGGHTAEMIRLLEGLDFEKYGPRIYVVSSGDTLSEGKARDLEKRKQKAADGVKKVHLYCIF